MSDEEAKRAWWREVTFRTPLNKREHPTTTCPECRSSPTESC